MLRGAVEMPESDGRQLPRMSWTYDLTKGVVVQTRRHFPGCILAHRTVLMDGGGAQDWFG